MEPEERRVDMKKQILVIGSLNMDLTMDLKTLPQTGETVLAESLMYNLGGKGANQACAAAKLGGRVKMIGCVGKDGFGEKQLEALRISGVNVSGVKAVSELPTGTAVICVDRNGNNCILVVQGANLACDRDYIRSQQEAVMESDYILLQMEIPHDALYEAIRYAKAAGKTVILNPAPAPESIPDEILGLIDYLTPNETELLRLAEQGTGTSEQESRLSGQQNRLSEQEPDRSEQEAAQVSGNALKAALQKGAERLLQKGVGAVIATMGKEGCMVFRRSTASYYPAVPVRAVDTTAAGDCFNGAFAAALASGLTETEAVRYANCASAISVTRRGAQCSLPSGEEVLKFMKKGEEHYAVLS